MAAVFLFGGTANGPKGAQAASPGRHRRHAAELSQRGRERRQQGLVGDILAVVQAYFKDWPATNYVYLYDLTNPYNPQTGLGGQQRVDDILAVVSKYFTSSAR